MQRVAAIALVTSLLATTATAQSQIALSVSRELRRAGVSEDCIGRLSSHDFASLKGIQDAKNRSPGAKRNRMAFEARRACGEAQGVLTTVFGQSRTP